MACRSTATAKSNTGGALTATPAGVVAGDYLGAGFAADDSTPATISNTGWAQKASANLASSAPDGHTITWLEKVATGSDSFSFVIGTANPDILHVGAWSGRSGVAVYQTSTQTVGQATPITAAVTGITAQAGDDIGLFLAADQMAGADQWSYTQPAGYTERQDDTNASWCGATLDTRDNVSAGATGTLNVVITEAVPASNAGWGAIVIAIRAAATAQAPRRGGRPFPFVPGGNASQLR